MFSILKRYTEVFQRWAEHAAFTVIMRTHEGVWPEISVQFDSNPEVLTHFVRMSKIFVYLKPYTNVILEEYYSSGLPADTVILISIMNKNLNYYNLNINIFMNGPLFVGPVIRPHIKN